MTGTSHPEPRVEDAALRIRQRLKDNFLHYAAKCLRILTKTMAVAPFVLNRAQRHIHELLERQTAATGKVRALILKGRQQGCSTYVEGRFYWKVTHRLGAYAFILTHEDAATQNIFRMAERFHEHCPRPVKPRAGTANAKELQFDLLDSGYKVATAGKKEAGRSGTVQFFHGSEVAFWPNAETHLAGAMQQVPDQPGTEIILESTSAGASGMFYHKCMDALAGRGDYILIFIPWFWQAEYRRPAPRFDATPEESGYARPYALTAEQLAWRRAKISELGGIHVFRREYPSSIEEAFRAEMPGALWTRAVLDQNRRAKYPKPLARIVVAVDPAATSDEKKSNECGLVVVARGIDGDAYVLEDASGIYKPDAWARRAVTLYHEYEADRVLAETNQGGEMVEHTLRTVDKNVAYRGVHASRGKQARAEPVAALYEQGRVHHVGLLPALEDQLCTWVPGHDSPDRLDAVVWAITDLLLRGAPARVQPTISRRTLR